MKPIYIAVILTCAVIWAGCDRAVSPSGANALSPVDDSPIVRAFNDGTSGVQVEGEGVVTRVLGDDIEGNRHQRFIVRLASGQTVLIAHNIDVAPRVAGLKEGDSVRFYGQYEWNEKGGTVHWTHRDLKGKHVAGWVKHNGRTYQ